MDAASEIAVAKDNVARGSGSASMSAMSVGDKSKSNAKCGYRNSESHNANGLTTEARQKFCKAFGKGCDKCGLDNHISVACRADKIKKRRDEKAKKCQLWRGHRPALESRRVSNSWH